jgi:formylglycine-generating enzyme required for sulfatase activity
MAANRVKAASVSGGYMRLTKNITFMLIISVVIGALYAGNLLGAFPRRQQKSAAAQPVGYFVLNNDIPYTPFGESVFRDNLITGVSLRANWESIEPSEGRFQWVFDEDIEHAKRAGGKVILRCYTGFRGQGIPDWIYKAGAQKFEYMDAKWGNEMKNGQMMAMPIPWDAVFLKKWTALVQAMGQRYGREDAIVLIQMAGPDYTGGEMHLPKSAEDRAHWMRVGYTKDRLTGAWKAVIDAYAAAFPGKCLALNVSVPLLQDGAVEEVLGYAERKLGKRFCVQHNGLAAKTVPDWIQHKWVVQSRGKAIIGFQQLCPVTPQGAFNDNGRRYGGTLEPSLVIGLYAGMQYLEAYPPDLTGDNLRPVFYRYRDGMMANVQSLGGKARRPEVKSAVPKPGAASSTVASPASTASLQQRPLPSPKSPPKQKLAVPNEVALAPARKAADALFTAEIVKAESSADKADLAKRLLAQALDQTGDPPSKYVLMFMAHDLAVAARDADAAFQIIDQMAEAFEVDRFAMKTGVLTGWAKEARTSDARKSFVEQAIDVGNEALDAGNLEAAKELGRLATSKSGGLRDKNLAQKLKVYRQRFTEAGKDAQKLQEARAALAKDSQDPKANLLVGQYLCFTKGDWEKGLSLLAQGSDETLKGLAHQELTSPPTQPNEQVAVADAWWEIAQTRRRSQMDAIKIHAGQWYRQADAALSPGLVKDNVEKRLAEVAELQNQLLLPPPAITPFDAKQVKQLQKQWAEHLGLPIEEKNSIGMPLVLIPPGEFDMGSTPEEIKWALEEGKKTQEQPAYFDWVPTEAPRHRVKITKPFYLGMYQVTQAEYEQVMGVNPSAFTTKQMAASEFSPPLPEAAVKSRLGDRQKVAGKDTSRHPVETVNWDDAIEFCRRLSAMPAERAAKRVYQLPTEAEWEYACRAGTTSRWYCGDDEAGLVDVAWFGNNSDLMTHPVGEKRPNAWGLYDMYGNAWQWCADWFSADYYKKSSPSDPNGPTTASIRVLRGGGWADRLPRCRSAYRQSLGPAHRGPYFGFRVAAGP